MASLLEQVPSELPVLPIRNAVVFPSVSLPLVVGRNRSLQALDHAAQHDNLLLIVTQKMLSDEDPDPEDIYSMGTLCKIENMASPGEGGSRQIVVTGLSRYRVSQYSRSPDGHLIARGEAVGEVHSSDTVRSEALFYNLKEMSREILELVPGATEPMVRLIDRIEDSAYLAHICSAYINLPIPQKQALLETDPVEDRIEILLKHMRREREILNLQREIREKMSERLNKAQRDALLREQLRTIRTELGEEGAEEETADELEFKIKSARLPEEAMKQAREELKRLKGLPSNSAEYHVVRTYLEWLAGLPWEVKSESRINLASARKILDEDHSGLEDVKKRILQFLAVAKLKNDLHGPILCLIGPPGVGKTSVGQSIARALGRSFARVSLGGVRDEAEIRGHRRTYVGAMPGRIIQSIKRAGTRNPVMMLDEIDKLHHDFHGDPSAAMLEVLDPEQNKSFSDHYLDVPFDLSDVFFIATANVIDTIPAPLRDRMEIIEMHGYTSYEKLKIARLHLIPKIEREHGFQAGWVEIPDTTLEALIQNYTREAGVRELQRKIAALYRSAAEQIVERPTSFPIRIGPDTLKERLGPERFFPESNQRINRPGVATGLAWTPHGGDLLYIESTALPEGRGHLTLTGQLGDVMKESAQIALSLARSAIARTLPKTFEFQKHDIHVHVPGGAIPKDGPSAGVTILSSLASILMDQPIRNSVAMTGEITLRGTVLPVGGIKEKILAAHRGGIQTVLIPARNQPDLEEIPEEVRSQLNLIPVETIEEVLAHAFDLPAFEEKAPPRAA